MISFSLVQCLPSTPEMAGGKIFVVVESFSASFSFLPSLSPSHSFSLFSFFNMRTFPPIYLPLRGALALHPSPPSHKAAPSPPSPTPHPHSSPSPFLATTHNRHTTHQCTCHPLSSLPLPLSPLSLSAIPFRASLSTPPLSNISLRAFFPFRNLFSSLLLFPFPFN